MKFRNFATICRVQILAKASISLARGARYEQLMGRCRSKAQEPPKL
jgi:hypothetical protein